jgi:hypothetical protein
MWQNAVTSRLRCVGWRPESRLTSLKPWSTTRYSPGLNAAFPETAAWLSLVAYVRHTLTDYDELLREGYDRDSARFFVGSEIAAILDSWGVQRRLTSED